MSILLLVNFYKKRVPLNKDQEIYKQMLANTQTQTKEVEQEQGAKELKKIEVFRKIQGRYKTCTKYLPKSIGLHSARYRNIKISI